MPEPDETHIKNEIGEISKSIDAILKEIEQERKRFLPASTENNPSKSHIMPVEDDQKNKSSPSDVETTGELPEI